VNRKKVQLEFDIYSIASTLPTYDGNTAHS